MKITPNLKVLGISDFLELLLICLPFMHKMTPVTNGQKYEFFVTTVFFIEKQTVNINLKNWKNNKKCDMMKL